MKVLPVLYHTHVVIFSASDEHLVRCRYVAAVHEASTVAEW